MVVHEERVEVVEEEEELLLEQLAPAAEATAAQLPLTQEHKSQINQVQG